MQMRRMFYFFSVMGVSLLIGLMFGCSGSSSSPALPDLNEPLNPTVQGNEGESGHMILGEYLISIHDEYGPDGTIISAVPEIIPRRTTDIHVNVVAFVSPPKCPDCTTITLWNLNVQPSYIEYSVNVEFRNPTNILGHDVRGIIYPPAAKVQLMNFDGYTKLFNSGMPETRNPYKAYNFDTDFRPFEGHAKYERPYVLRRALDYPLLSMVYKLDASWPSNAGEAVSCEVPTVLTPIYPNGSQAFIIAQVKDWQMDVASVELDLSALGSSPNAQMDKISENPALHTSAWQYHLTEGGGNPAGVKTIWLTAYDSVETTPFIYKFDITVVYDTDPPGWLNPGEEGFYDHVSSPGLLWMFYYEAWDVSQPVEYIFWGNNQSPPYAGSQLNVLTTYNGYTQFGPIAAPDNTERWYGIQLKDAQGWLEGNPTNEYSCTRYSVNPRLTYIHNQPSGVDGVLSGPSLGDVNGDGMDDIVIGTRNSEVQVIRGDATGTGGPSTLIWTFNTGGEIQTTPALVDLNNDNKLDVVVSCDKPSVYAINGANGLQLWEYPAGEGFLIRSSPAIAYMNQDSVPDVIVGMGNNEVVALDGTDGSELWTYMTEGGVAGCPAVADVTGDDIPDVCIGAYDTKVHMINGATGAQHWVFHVGPGLNNVDCPIVLADVNGDSVPDAIFGARKSGTSEQMSGLLYAVDGSTGDQIWKQDQIWGNVRRGVAPVYLNDDSVIDFIVTSYHTSVWSFYAVNGANGAILFQNIGSGIPTDLNMNYSGALVGDFTGDGHINAMYGRSDGYVDLVLLDGAELPGDDWPGKHLMAMQVSSGNKLEIYGTPAVGDVDNDNELELIVCNMRGYTYVLDMHAPVPADAMIWTQHQGNRWCTGTPGFVPPD